MNYRQFFQMLYYGWHHSKEIRDKVRNGESSVRKSRIGIFFDIIHCYNKYKMWSNQYLKEKMYNVQNEKRDEIGEKYVKGNAIKTAFVNYYYSNRRFLAKYGSTKYDMSYRLSQKRNKAFIKRYNMGEGCQIRTNVLLMSVHNSVGKLVVGKNVDFSRNIDVDYTGDLYIGDNVGILEGSKIITHAHDSYHFMKDSDLIPFSNRAYKTNLKIGDHVTIGAHAIILPGVSEIGEGAIIQAGAIVNRPVPPNVIVAGNPATVVRKIPAKRWNQK